MGTMAKAGKSTLVSCDAMVTARVPRGVKERGDAILREIGASPTKLVNAAYDYVLENKSLPVLSADAVPLRPGIRRLGPLQKKELGKHLKDLRAGKLQGDLSFEEMLDDALLDRLGGDAGEVQKAS